MRGGLIRLRGMYYTDLLNDSHFVCDEGSFATVALIRRIVALCCFFANQNHTHDSHKHIQRDHG